MLQSNVQPTLKLRMAAVREAFRRRRLAHEQRRLYDFYVEHSLLDQASSTRASMLDHLRAASGLWRTTLGMSL